MSTKVTDKLFAYSYEPPKSSLGKNFENSLVIIGKEQQIWQPLTNSYVGIGLSRFNSVADSINNIPDLLTSTYIWGQQFSYDSLTGKFNDIQGNIDVQGNISNVYNIIPKTSNNYNIGNSLNYFAEGYISYLKGYTYNVILTNIKSNSIVNQIPQNNRNKMYMIFGFQPNGKLCYCPEFKITNLGTSNSSNIILLSRSADNIGENTINSYIPILYVDGNTYVNGNSYINGISYAQTTYTIQSSYANKFIKHDGKNYEILLADGSVCDRRNIVEYASSYWANMRLSPSLDTTTTPQFRSVSINTAMGNDSYNLKVNGDGYLNGNLIVTNDLDVSGVINANDTITTHQKFISTNGGLQISNLANSEDYILKADGTYIQLTDLYNDDHKVKVEQYSNNQTSKVNLMLTDKTNNQLSYAYYLSNLQYDIQSGNLIVENGIKVSSITVDPATYLLTANGTCIINNFVTKPSGTIGSTTKGIYWNGSAFTACNYDLNATINSGTQYHLTHYKDANTIEAYNTSIGSTTKGMYLSNGVPMTMTYELSANVNTGTTDYLAYYKNDNTIAKYIKSVGSTTKGIYFNNGIPTVVDVAVESGGTNKLTYYSSSTKIEDGDITTNGKYLANITNLTIGGNHQTTYALSATGKIKLNGGTYITKSSYIAENNIVVGYTYSDKFIKKGGTGDNVLLDNGTVKAITSFSGDHKVKVEQYTGQSEISLITTDQSADALTYAQTVSNLKYNIQSGNLIVGNGIKVATVNINDSNGPSYLLNAVGSYSYLKSGDGISISRNSNNNDIIISANEDYNKFVYNKTNLTITTTWTSLHTFATTMTSGLYSILVNVAGIGYYSGTMSIDMDASTNYTDEIMLHGGHSSNNRIYLRTNGTTLEIACETGSLSNKNVTITLKKII